MSTEKQSQLFEADADVQNPTVINIRPCDWCGKEYSNIYASMYCSTSCKNNASRKRVKERQRSALGTEKTATTPVLANNGGLAGTLDLPAHAKFIIAQQEKEITRWEANFNKEQDKREKAEADFAKLKEQMKDMEHKKALDGIESARPDFMEKLQQFIPEPIREKVLGAIADKLLTPGPIAGIAGQLDGEGQQQLTNISNWFSSLPKEGQMIVYNILDLLAAQPAEQVGVTLNHILNLLKNGTTAAPNNHANFGT